MNKPATIIFGTLGALSFAVSAARPAIARDAVRFVRWHHDWR